MIDVEVLRNMLDIKTSRRLIDRIVHLYISQNKQ